MNFLPATRLSYVSTLLFLVFSFVARGQDASAYHSIVTVKGGHVKTIELTIKIGEQTWMASNLNVSVFQNGDRIMEINTEEAWVNAASQQKPAWCYYDYDPANEKKYGKLYNWFAVIDPRGLAPSGWRIAGDFDWYRLTDYLGGESVAGAKMKAISGWDGSGNGTNSSGFGAVPAGITQLEGSFLSGQGSWWCGALAREGQILGRSTLTKSGDVVTYSYLKGNGLSVRCVKN